MTSPIRKLIGKKLKEHRLKSKMTQALAAEALNCEDSTIGRYERGEHSPDGEMLIEMARLYGVSPLDFLPTDVEAHWKTVSELRSTLIDLIFRINEPVALSLLIEAAQANHLSKR